MALNYDGKCKKCGNQVHRELTSCPHCALKKPTSKNNYVVTVTVTNTLTGVTHTEMASNWHQANIATEASYLGKELMKKSYEV